MTEDKVFWKWMEKNSFATLDKILYYKDRYIDPNPQMLIGFYIEYLVDHGMVIDLEVKMFHAVDDCSRIEFETIDEYAFRLEKEIERLSNGM